MKKAFIFDVDGTLVDTGELHIDAWRKAFAAFDIAISTPAIQEQLGRRAVEIAEALVPEDRADLRKDIVEAKWRAFRDSYGDIKAFPKVKELFAYHKDRALAVLLRDNPIIG